MFSVRYQDLVELLVRVRKDASVTQLELASRLGRPQSFVSKIERRERRIDVVEFCAWAEALGISPDRLLKQFLKGGHGQ